MGHFKNIALTHEILKLNKIVNVIIIFLLFFVPPSHCLKGTHTSDTVKRTSSKQSHLAAKKQLAVDVLRTKYSFADLGENTVYLNAATTHPVDVNGNHKQDGSNESNEDSIKNKLKDWNTVVVGVIILTSTFAILMMSISKLIENKIDDTQDTFLKNAFNMCYKQIALIGVINLVLWLILQTKIATKLDNIIFEENQIQPNSKGFKSIVEPIFECLLSISVILLAWYIIYVIYFQFVVKRTIAWMRKADNSDVLTVSKALEISENALFICPWNQHNVGKGRFLANRFEFIDNINNMSVPKIDPGGYYFMEYLRANLLDVSVQMLRFPREVLLFVIVLSIILRKTFTFEGRREVLLISIICCLCAASMVFLGCYVHYIELKLYPAKLSEYLLFKYNTNDMEISRNFDQSLLPPYKLGTIEDESNNFLVSLVHGDGPVNKHENLFVFKSKGPKVLVKLFEIICFSFLFTLSIWVYLVQQHQATWLKRFRFGNYFVLVNVVIIALSIPRILYSLIVVGKTGLLIDFDTVEKVWESHRSNNTRHAMELIDALNLDSVITSLNRNGETYWRHLLAKLKTSPLAIQKQMGDIWSGLDTRNKGVIGMNKILRFISSQGLQITSKKKIKEFVKSFTRTQPYKLTEEEFLVLGLVIKQIIVIPLDTSQMKVLFEEEYGIPWTAPYGIEPETLQHIVNKLGLKWSEGDRRHLLDFLRGCRCEGMSAERFIEQLSTVEQLLKPTEYNNLVLEV